MQCLKRVFGILDTSRATVDGNPASGRIEVDFCKAIESAPTASQPSTPEAHK
jgi:hypothetical protein